MAEDTEPDKLPRREVIQLSFWQFVACYFVPILTYLSLSGLVAYGLMLRFSPWLAVPLGLVVGAAVLAVWIAGQGGTSTVVELNMACIILLILLVILVPVFVKLRHARLYPHHRSHSHPASLNSSPQKKALP